ncbi:MAG: hypothetical protein LBU17_02150 [Treponema sp.]|jgi:hypothetical protein|nr:hypothetical protein [Treponema sp.]
MAKAIKFNLIIDKQPIRDLEDLQANFNVEDILEVFHNGSLQRWLEVRGLTEELGKLQQVKGEAPVVAAELCKIFCAPCTKDDAANAAYIFELRQKEEARLRQYQNLKEEQDEVILAYHSGYERLLKELGAKGDEYPFTKAAVQEIFEKYVGLYRLDAHTFYRRFIDTKPLVILAELANPNMRPLMTASLEEVFQSLSFLKETSETTDSDIKAFLDEWKNSKTQIAVKKVNDSIDNADLQAEGEPILMLDCNNDHSQDGKVISMSKLGSSWYPFTYIEIADISTHAPLPNMPSHIKSFAGETEGYWKDIEQKGKQYLVIKMESGNVVRNTGKSGEELKAEDINGKFFILDGIDYKSNNANHKLVYMEI